MAEHGGDIYNNQVNLDFSVNTSPYGIPPRVRAAVSKAMLDIGAYPDPQYDRLREAIGQQEGISPEHIICGNGASELIYSTALTLSRRVKSTLVASVLVPCFLEYERACRAAGFSEIRQIKLKEDNSFTVLDEDIDGLLLNATVVILGNPNNPTGRLLPIDWLIRLIAEAEKRDIYVVLDESFLPLTLVQDEYRNIHSNNLIRIKAYTKSMAIPGVRIGYLICENDSLIKAMRDTLPDWNVSIIASSAGIASTQATRWLQEKISDTGSGLVSLRNQLTSELMKLGIEVFESDTCFVLVRTPVELYDLLLREGILIRDCSNFTGIEKGYYRIAVKSKAENERLIQTLKKVLGHNQSESANSYPIAKTDSGQLLCVKPSEIEHTSFEILTSELETQGIYLDGDTAPVIKRCIHTSADFEYAITLTFSHDAVKKAQELIRKGACIVTDTNMALAGINKTELAKYGGEAYCFMADPDIAQLARESGRTRASVSMEHAAGLGRKIIFVVGNAPTALVSLCEMMDANRFKPDFVVGVPVGFVNVEQAKEMIIDRDLDYIVNRGRKGGSNVAAAIVNAILYSMRDQ